MEVKKPLQSLAIQLRKYRHAALILVIGMVLLAFPSIVGKNETVIEQPQEITAAPTLEEKLCEALEHLSGAGEVHVMLSIAEGEHILYQTDTDSSAGTDTQLLRENTVLVSDGQRNESGLIRQVIPARYQGVVVLCTGADDPSVRLAVVDAVSKLTGLGANRISVLKMK